MRRYYHLHDDHTTSPKKQQKKNKRSTKVVAEGDISEVGGAGVEDHTHSNEAERDDVSSEGSGAESGAESDSSTDVEDIITLKEPEVGVACGCGFT